MFKFLSKDKADSEWPFWICMGKHETIKLNLSRGIRAGDMDSWCSKHLGEEHTYWRRVITSIWEFRNKEDLVLFTLTWG